MRLVPDGEALWVLCREARCLARVTVTDLRVARRIRLPGAGEDFDISRDGQLAVAFPKDGRVGFAGPAATAIESLAAAGPDPWVVRFQFNPTQLIVGNRAARSITLVDVRGARAVVHLPIPVEPASFCFNVDGGQLFVAGPGLDAVVIVDPYHTQISETILAGKLPGAMACSETPQYLFVSNPSSATVTVLDIETRKLVAVVGVGQDPGQILITPDGQYAMVLNRQSGDLAVFRVGALRFDPEGNTRRYTAPPLFSLIPVGPRPVSAAILMA